LATIGQAEFKEGCLGTGECDDEDTAWRILGGYQFTKADAFELVAVGSFPITDKVGAYQGTLEGLDVDEDTTDRTYGIGVRWDFTKRLGGRGEWQRYEKLGGGNLLETDLRRLLR
jgi:hypothetical protein